MLICQMHTTFLPQLRAVQRPLDHLRAFGLILRAPLSNSCKGLFWGLQPFEETFVIFLRPLVLFWDFEIPGCSGAPLSSSCRGLSLCLSSLIRDCGNIQCACRLVCVLRSHYVIRALECSPDSIYTLLSLICHDLAEVLVIACKKIACMPPLKFLGTQAPLLLALAEVCLGGFGPCERPLVYSPIQLSYHSLHVRT